MSQIIPWAFKISLRKKLKRKPAAFALDLHIADCWLKNSKRKAIKGNARISYDPGIIN